MLNKSLNKREWKQVLSVKVVTLKVRKAKFQASQTPVNFTDNQPNSQFKDASTRWDD